MTPNPSGMFNSLYEATENLSDASKHLTVISDGVAHMAENGDKEMFDYLHLLEEVKQYVDDAVEQVKFPMEWIKTLIEKEVV